MADAETLPEIDRVLRRMRRSDGGGVTLTHDDARWLLAEIDGGREAFATVVQQKRGLELQVAKLQRTIADLSGIIAASRKER